jgi:glycosyltransferase involved in cell wall biosynthesis
MASGIPVVQPSLGAFPEIIKKAGGGMVYEPNSPKALAEKLAEVLSDAELHDKLSREGRKGVEKHFHIDKQVKEMISIYKEAVLSKTSSPS